MYNTCSFYRLMNMKNVIPLIAQVKSIKRALSRVPKSQNVAFMHVYI